MFLIRLQEIAFLKAKRKRFTPFKQKQISTSKKLKESWGLRLLQANSSRAWKYPSNNEQKVGNNYNTNPEKQENILLIPTLNPFVFPRLNITMLLLVKHDIFSTTSNFLLNWFRRES